MIGHAHDSFRYINAFLEEGDRDKIESSGFLEGRIIVIDEEKVFPLKAILSNNERPDIKAGKVYELSIPNRIFNDRGFKDDGFYSLKCDYDSFESKLFCFIDIERLREIKNVDNHYLLMYDLLRLQK